MTDKLLLREVASRGIIVTDRNQLQRFDWLHAALELFVKEGIDAVRITQLADQLNVSRGSFYWHFTNRKDLVEALVSYWRDKNTRAIVDAMEGARSLSDGIFRFFETCLDTKLFDSRLDLAIREWARRSGEIQNDMDRADSHRIQSIADFFSRHDYVMPEALIRARVIYFAQIGFYALDVSEKIETRLGYTDAYFECFTGKKLKRQETEQFRNRVLKKFGESVS